MYQANEILFIASLLVLVSIFAGSASSRFGVPFLLVFLGLGCPRQDVFASTYKDRIKGVQLCVGAAFDFHAGNKKMAPRWMQRSGLEWLFRLAAEPRRLGPRYLVTNPLFALRVLAQKTGLKKYPLPVSPRPTNGDNA